MTPDGPSFEGMTAVVTGAARGLGGACAAKLRGAGANLVGADLLFTEGAGGGPAALVDGGGKMITIGADVADPDAGRRIVEAALEAFGRVDILVNAAGTLAPTRFLDIPLDEWQWIIDVNVTGAFVISQAAARPMVEQGWGRIVHFASTAAKTVSTLGGAHYTASKHAVLGLTRASAKELAPHGVTVNAVCPGLVDTDGARGFLGREALEDIARSFPVPRPCQPDEVAELVCFLCRPTAGYITGAAFDINGGDLLA